MHIRALTDGGAGMRAQACGLAQQLAASCTEDIAGNIPPNIAPVVTHQVVHTPSIVRVLPPQWSRRAWHVFSPPEILSSIVPSGDSASDNSPDIIIGCGAAAQSAVLAYKKECGAFAVCIQRPRAGGSHFDAIIAPLHDYDEDEINPQTTAKNARLFVTVGSVGLINQQLLTARRAAAQARFSHIPSPRTALLVGGDNRAFALNAAVCQTLAESLLATKDGGILSTVSRRTAKESTAVLATAFNNPHCFFYDGNGDDNPYIDILAAADRFVVTADSVNMLSEASVSARPVFIAALPEKNARLAKKFNRFHTALQSRNCARRWDGKFTEWESHGLDETARAADFIWQQYRARQTAVTSA